MTEQRASARAEAPAARAARVASAPRVPVGVRAARVDDARAIAEAHVRAWQAAYRDVMPHDHLDGLDPVARAAGWADALRGLTPERRVLVATLDDAPAGFVVVGAAAEPTGGVTGQLHALNVHPDRWGAGVGSALLHAAGAALSALGHAGAVLWVVTSNARARRLYERHGWHADGAERVEDVAGAQVPELRYRTATAAAGVPPAR